VGKGKATVSLVSRLKPNEVTAQEFDAHLFGHGLSAQSKALCSAKSKLELLNLVLSTLGTC
jgi:hypothetical protein